MMILSTLQYILKHPLNHEHKLNALERYLRWQVGSRLLKEEVAYHWIGGLQLLLRTGELGLTGNIYCGLHEYSSMAFALHLLREDDIFFDIGANVGSYSLLASGIAGATSFAFEPVPETFERMQKNLRINNLEDRVHAMCMALGEKTDHVLFTSSQNTVNHVVREGESKEDSISVEMQTVDQILQKYNSASPTLIKIDVEGFETPVLRGAIKTLEDPLLCGLIIEFAGSGEQYGYSEKKLFRWISSHGFAPFDYDPMQRKLSPLSQQPIPKSADQTHDNLLMIRDVERVQERLLHAPSVSIYQTII